MHLCKKCMQSEFIATDMNWGKYTGLALRIIPLLSYPSLTEIFCGSGGVPALPPNNNMNWASCPQALHRDTLHMEIIQKDHRSGSTSPSSRKYQRYLETLIFEKSKHITICWRDMHLWIAGDLLVHIKMNCAKLQGSSSVLRLPLYLLGAPCKSMTPDRSGLVTKDASKLIWLCNKLGSCIHTPIYLEAITHLCPILLP